MHLKTHVYGVGFTILPDLTRMWSLNHAIKTCPTEYSFATIKTWKVTPDIIILDDAYSYMDDRILA